MLTKLVKPQEPRFTTHMETFLKNNPEFAIKDLKVDKMTYLRDPNNIFNQFGIPNANGYMRRILMRGPKQFELNNTHNQKRWATAIVNFYNEPGTQSEMRYAELAHFAGNVTPQDESTAAPLSNWLTAQDTIDYILQVQDDCSSFSDVLGNDDLMGLYFNQEDIPWVRAQLNPDAQGPGRNVLPGDALDF